MRDGVLIGRRGAAWDVLGLPSEPVQVLQAKFKQARGSNCELTAGKPYDEIRLYEGGCFQGTKRALPVVQAAPEKDTGKGKGKGKE